MTDILLFGIFHFNEENIDFSLDEIQSQLSYTKDKQKIAANVCKNSGKIEISHHGFSGGF